MGNKHSASLPFSILYTLTTMKQDKIKLIDQNNLELSDYFLIGWYREELLISLYLEFPGSYRLIPLINMGKSKNHFKMRLYGKRYGDFVRVHFYVKDDKLTGWYCYDGSRKIHFTCKNITINNNNGKYQIVVK